MKTWNNKGNDFFDHKEHFSAVELCSLAIGKDPEHKRLAQQEWGTL